MTTAYVPREGSIAAQAVEVLRQAGKPMTDRQIRDEIEGECSAGSLIPYIGSAVRHGMVAVEQRDGATWYRMGDGVPLFTEEAEPTPPPRVKDRTGKFDQLTSAMLFGAAPTTDAPPPAPRPKPARKYSAPAAVILPPPQGRRQKASAQGQGSRQGAPRQAQAARAAQRLCHQPRDRAPPGRRLQGHRPAGAGHFLRALQHRRPLHREARRQLGASQPRRGP